MGNVNGAVPENHGFKIVEVISRSPGERAGLIVDIDFILTVNGKKLRKLTPEQIKNLIQINEEKDCQLKVYSSTTGQIREVTIVPTKNWPGKGLLGLRIRLEPYGALNVESALTDSEFNWDDIYSHDKEDGVSYGTQSAKDDSAKLAKSNSIIDTMMELSPFGRAKSGKF